MNVTEISEDTLTLYYYNDGLTPRERQQVASALAVDNNLAESYQDLCQDLDSFSGAKEPAAPTHLVERWHDSIKHAAGRNVAGNSRPTLHTWSFVWGAAITAALAVGIGIGVLLPSGDSGQMDPIENALTVARPASAFIRGLQVHLRDSETSLSQFSNSSDTDKTELIMSIIAQNRIYEKAAVRNEDDSIARVLRAFELVLLDLTAAETTPEDADALRAKLLFELNIMLTKISLNTSDEQQTI